MERNYSDLVFENYEGYLKEHSDEIANPQNAMEMLASKGAFKAYASTLTEGLPATIKPVVEGILERERDSLLEESANIGPTASAIGYAVTNFPILVDIYSDPVLSQIATIYPVSKSIITIPRIKTEGSVVNMDGTTTTYVMPRTTNLMRGASMALDLAAPANDLYSLAAAGGATVTSSDSILNKRYLFITNIKANNGTVDIDTPVTVRPDARGQLKGEFKFTDGADTVTAVLIGNVNWDSASIQYNITYTTTGALTYTTTSVSANVVFSPTTGDVGRVKVTLKSDGYDVEIAVRDEFEIALSAEQIQDYRDIWNIDLVRHLSTAIKSQMLANKDYDLATYLSSYEPEFAANGTAKTVDLAQFVVAGGDYTPANVLDVFKGVIPAISAISRRIRKNFRADPQYLVCGLETASLLESLQDYTVSFDSTRAGSAGFTGETASGFRKQMVIACDAISDDKIYVIYKPAGDKLETSALIELLYKPLYMITETTNSQARTFVKSRTALEIVAPEAFGVITLSNHATYF